MQLKNTTFVVFHRPGRIIFIFTVLTPIVLFIAAVTGEQQVLLLTLIGAPLCIYICSILSKRQLLPIKSSVNSNYKKLKTTGISWIYRVKGSGIKGFDRNNYGLSRTVADQSLFLPLQNIQVPDGLVEPEKIYGSNPSNAFGTVIGCIICVLSIIGCFRLMQSAVPSNIKTISWFAIGVLALAFCILFFSFPVFQKNKTIPDFLRLLGRGQLFKKSFIAGPGWVKYGKILWQGNTDILLIRRAAFRSSRAEIECLLVSKFARQRIRFSGVDDVDFQTLLGFWNVDEVRLEFVDSNIA